MSEWVETNWGEISELVYGKALRKDAYAGGGVEVFGTNGPIGWHDTELFPPGVVVGRKGAYRGIHYASGPCWVIDTAFYLKVDRQRVDDRWAYYLLKTVDLDAIDSGSAIPSTTRPAFGAIPVRVPPLDLQRRQIDVLQSIDDLIENNRRRIEVLEEMAQATYREWFVHFRYPGHEDATFIGSPLGAIPEGSEVRTLGDCASLLKRGSAPKYADDGQWRVVNQRCIRNHEVNLAISRRSSKNPSSERRLCRGDVLVNSTGVGTLGRVALLLDDSQDLTADTHVTIIRPKLGVYNPWFGLALTAMEPDFEAMGAGSTGQTELSRKLLDGLRLIVPTRKILTDFAAAVGSAVELGFSLSKQNNQLASIRDLLLPKLVTGEIDVSSLDLDALVGAAS